MSRSARWRRLRRSEWSRTARTDHWRRGLTTGGTAPLSPDPASDLSDGVVVSTQLLGRILGLRVLRVDGTVLVAPARVVSPVERPAGPPTPEAPPVAPGGGLAEAARLIAENDAVLGRRPLS